jgi:L-serine dehydratase
MNSMRADHISPLEIFKIGIGPSSSHTVGPMLAARQFRRNVVNCINKQKQAGTSLHVTVELFGSLSATGQGHSTDGAVCAGLIGLHPQESSIEQIWKAMPDLQVEKKIDFDGVPVAFEPDKDLKWCGWTIDEKVLPHPNTIRFSLLNGDKLLLSEVVASVGGGFVNQIADGLTVCNASESGAVSVPHPYNTAAEFVSLCETTGLTPAQIVIENEEARGLSESELRKGLKKIWNTIEECIERGLATDGILPGGLNVRRRAKALNEQLKKGTKPVWSQGDLRPSVYAIAVNEENAAGGRVVTAPTNGSSGLIPGVFRTLKEEHNLSEDVLVDGLIVASVIGALVKVHASISGAEVGCQGEVGTSCAMAAGGATAMLGGTPRQIEQAAEIGIEHHLGMTCDPIKGLVQVPCIERNAMGAVKALNAVSLALACDGSHLVSLDRVLEVMKQTGLDMHQKYKETATGGLALG